MQYLRRIPYYLVVAFLIYMPLHIFLSQSLSLLTGGLEAWKVAKDALLAIAVLFTICLVFKQKQGSRAFWILAGLTTVYGAFHALLWLIHPDIYGRSAILGFVMNLRVPAFALLGFGAYLLLPTPPGQETKSKFVFSSLTKVVLGVSSIVVVLGLLQYLLPKDILTHVGYGLDRGVRPAFFIDDNPAFPRIMSTLREPNALAAYLLLPISLLGGLLVTIRERRKQIVLGVVLALHILTLYLTFSRSALIALIVSLGLIAAWRYGAVLVAYLKRWWPVVAVAVVLLGAGAFIARDTFGSHGLISHSTPDVAGQNDLDSNDYHWLFFKQGIEGIAAQPFGHGPGTAGLASIQNPAGSFLTENYYVQVGYEVGVLGLLLFIAITGWIYLRLRTQKDPLAIALLASFWGLFVMNMLLHTWANEAVAAQWWLLAGLAVAATHRRK